VTEGSNATEPLFPLREGGRGLHPQADAGRDYHARRGSPKPNASQQTNKRATTQSPRLLALPGNATCRDLSRFLALPRGVRVFVASGMVLRLFLESHGTFRPESSE
jgi:hypothetical protein